jgi:putative flippase GtrA
MRALASRLINDQRVQFLAVGGFNTALGYVLFVLFDRFVFAGIAFGYLLSLGASYALAICVAFVLYRRLVYRVTGHVIRDFARFVSVYLVAIAINALALPLLVEVVGLPAFVAQAIILIATTMLSFFGHKNFSFRRAPAGASVETDDPAEST